MVRKRAWFVFPYQTYATPPSLIDWYLGVPCVNAGHTVSGFRYYLQYVCQQPALYYKEGRLSRLVLQQCTLLRKKYRPTLWAINPHLQTVLSGETEVLQQQMPLLQQPDQHGVINRADAALRTLTCRAQYERHVVTTEDGGTVALDWFQPQGYAKLPTDAPIVLVLHGLTGRFPCMKSHRKPPVTYSKQCVTLL